MKITGVSAVISFIFQLTVIAGLVSSTPHPETNAQRLARGLNPNPPRFSRELSSFRTSIARGLVPSPVDSAKRSHTSPLPPATYTGRLQVRSAQDNHVLGYVRNWQAGGPISGLNFVDLDLEVKIVTANPAGPFDILATNPVFAAPFFVGAGSGAPGNIPILAVGDRRVVGFNNVEQTPPHSVPVASPNSGLLQESAIWSMNPATSELIAQWINPDGSEPPTILAYNARANALYFVGDIDAHNKDNNSPASAVKLFLVQ